MCWAVHLLAGPHEKVIVQIFRSGFVCDTCKDNWQLDTGESARDSLLTVQWMRWAKKKTTHSNLHYILSTLLFIIILGFVFFLVCSCHTTLFLWLCTETSLITLFNPLLSNIKQATCMFSIPWSHLTLRGKPKFSTPPKNNDETLEALLLDKHHKYIIVRLKPSTQPWKTIHHLTCLWLPCWEICTTFQKYVPYYTLYCRWQCIHIYHVCVWLCMFV